MAAGQLTTLSAARSSAVLDDADIRPGSATSLLRTIIGCYLRRLGGWIASADLMELMTTVGVSQTRTRTAILRVRSKGILTTEIRDSRAGYALEPAALPRLARGDRRIYSPRAMSVSDRWCLISYSIPESQRQLRHQLRRRLSWIGCGTVSAALWICPEYLTSEVQDIITDLGIREEAVIFLASESRLDGGLERAVARLVGPAGYRGSPPDIPNRVRIRCRRLDAPPGLRHLDGVLGRMASDSLRRSGTAARVASGRLAGEP